MISRSKTFRVFVSSTFSDLKAERNALQEFVFPRLRELCAQHGARFQAIDLRWGVSEEASLDQQTLNICLGEIERCQEVTPRPNFLVLLGDRYGWCPPPPQIAADEFEAILEYVTNEDRQLLHEWYWRDDNAVPPEYCLQPRQRWGDYEDYAAWEPVERRLHQILKAAVVVAMNLDGPQRLKYVASATHQEIVAGALKVEDAPEHVFCFFRTIKGLPQDERAEGFCDLVDDENRKKKPDREPHEQLVLLKAELSNLLGDNVHRYRTTWCDDGINLNHIGTLPEKLDDCLKLLEDQGFSSTLCEDVWRSLAHVILEEVSLLDDVDPLERETAAHDEFREERALFFIGREEILETIANYVDDTSRYPLAIWGVSGSGKSALLAKAIKNLEAKIDQKGQPEVEIIARFIGATPDSSNGRSLLESLCRQISRCYGKDESTVPGDYKELVQDFPKRLAFATAEKPLILFLDALDQLSDVNNARNLVWLPVELPEHVRLVVSTLPGECKSILERRLPPETAPVQLELMPTVQADQLLSSWLKNASRALQEHQWAEVLNKFSQEGCGLPLYLVLAFEEALHWKSYTDPKETRLHPDVPGVIRDLFARLSSKANHGQKLVSRSLGYLAAAKNGLSEDELLDVLSRDREVFNDFMERTYHKPPEERLPVVLWSRLYFDLKPYLAQRSADGTSLFGFYHRQVVEVVIEDYLKADVKPDRHSALAGYFSFQPLEIERRDAKVPNLRKLSELPYQQAHASDWDSLQGTLTDYHFLVTKVGASGLQPLIEDYNEGFQTGYNRPDLPLVQSALSLSAHVIQQDEMQFASQLTGRLLSYDLPTITTLLKQARMEQRAPWLRPLTASLMPPDSGLVRTLEGHTSFVETLAVTSDGRQVLSGDWDGTVKVWDLESGLELHTLKGHMEQVRSIVVTPDGRRVICSAGPHFHQDHTLKVWDLHTGKELTSVEGYSKLLNTIALSPDGRYIVSGSKGGILKVWDFQTGKVATTLTVTDYIHRIVFTPDGRCIVHGKYLEVWDLDNKAKHETLIGHQSVAAIVIVSEGQRAVTSGGSDGTLRVWDLSSGEMLSTIEHSDEVTAMAVTPCGMRAITGLRRGDIHVWNLKTGEEIFSVKGHPHWVRCVAITPDGQRAVSGAVNGSLKVWDLDNGCELGTTINHDSRVNLLVVTPDGQRCVSCSDDHTLKVCDLESGSELLTLRGHTTMVKALTLTPDGRRAVSGSEIGTLRVWDLETGEDVATLKGHTGSICAVEITPDGRCACSASKDNSIKVWDLDSGEVIITIEVHTGKATAVAATPDGRYAAAGLCDGTLQVWDLEKGQLLDMMKEHETEIGAVALTPDGQFAVSGSRDGTLHVWNLQHRKTLLTLKGHAKPVNMVAITPDGRRALSLIDTPTIWDLETGETLATDNSHNARWVSPYLTTAEGLCAVSGGKIGRSGGDLRVWNLESGEEQSILKGHTSPVEEIVLTPDSRYIVSASPDKTLRRWDPLSGQEMTTMKGHTGSISALAITPDGRLVISGADDCTLKVWDLETGELLDTLEGHTRGVKSILITPDGRNVISGSQDNTVRIWRIRTTRIITLGEKHVSRVFAVAVTPDSRWVVSASADSTLHSWCLQPGAILVRTLQGHAGWVRALAITPDGKYAISGSDDGSIKVWDLETVELLSTLEGHKWWVKEVSVSPDGQLVISASYDNCFMIWDLQTGTNLATLIEETNQETTVAIAPEALRAVSCIDDGTFTVWDLRHGRASWTLVRRRSGVPGTTGTPYTSSMGRSLAEQGKRYYGPRLGSGRLAYPLAVAVTPDGGYAVWASGDGILRLLDLNRKEEIAAFYGHTHPICAVAITPNGQRAVSASYDNNLKVWDLGNRMELFTLTGHTDWITDVVMTHDGMRAFSSSKDGSLRVWDLLTGRQITNFPAEGTLCTCSTTPDGRLVITGDDQGRVHILQLEGVEGDEVIMVPHLE